MTLFFYKINKSYTALDIFPFWIKMVVAAFCLKYVYKTKTRLLPIAWPQKRVRKRKKNPAKSLKANVHLYIIADIISTWICKDLFGQSVCQTHLPEFFSWIICFGVNDFHSVCLFILVSYIFHATTKTKIDRCLIQSFSKSCNCIQLIVFVSYLI